MHVNLLVINNKNVHGHGSGYSKSKDSWYIPNQAGPQPSRCARQHLDKALGIERPIAPKTFYA